MYQNKYTSPRPFPWKTVLAILGVALAAYLVYMGVRSLNDDQTSDNPAVAFATPIAVTQPAQASAYTPALTVQPASNNLADIIAVRLPSLDEIASGAPASILSINSIEFEDMAAPGVQVYTGNVQKDNEYLFPVRWCATSLDILNGNLQFMTTHFFVNDMPVPDEFVRGYVDDSASNWKCKYFSVVLGGWKANTQYILEVRRVMSQEISDGASNYPAGTYARKVIVDVR